MEDSILLQRLHEAEVEIHRIRAEISRPDGRGVGGLARKAGRFALMNWALVSFLLAVGAAVFVKVRYQVDYFEDARSISTTRNLSQFYQMMGDRLVLGQEWAEAEAAYRKAVEINPNNAEARFAIAKAQVFQPAEGERWAVPEVVKQRLDYLLQHFPDDPQLYLMRALEWTDVRGQPDSARTWYLKALERDPRLAAAHVNLGYLDMQQGDVVTAQRRFEAALRLEPRSVVANNNIGFLYLVRGNHANAVHHLRIAYVESPRLLTAINLGNAHRHAGAVDSAFQWHSWAMNVVTDTTVDMKKDRFVAGEWTFNYMPVQSGDTTTWRNTLVVFTPARKTAMIHLSLALDYAAQGDFESADRELMAAYRMDSSRDFLSYAVNDIRAMRASVSRSSDSAWFQKRADALAGILR
jgi:tetratricopeptide (TPR) repeat protein